MNTAFHQPKHLTTSVRHAQLATTTKELTGAMNKYILLCVAFILTGCATSGQRDLIDFNSKFNQNIPTNPQYKIEQVTSSKYQIVVYQGSSLLSEATTRAAYLSKAAYLAMENKCTEKSSLLGESSLRDNVDSWGYVNIIGYFNCNNTPINNQTQK